jgi:hypothetical protein
MINTVGEGRNLKVIVTDCWSNVVVPTRIVQKHRGADRSHLRAIESVDFQNATMAS